MVAGRQYWLLWEIMASNRGSIVLALINLVSKIDTMLDSTIAVMMYG